MKKTVKGYVTSVPVDEKQSRIAIIQDGVEYRILPKAAGVDLEDEINASVEVSGDLLVKEDVHYLTARIYKVLDDAAWDDDK
ncbi:MAG: hypothetical protein IK079_03645 [Desulfovibrio sp.]|nr:hypothetical protein [Desulfovibrio sp.]